MATFPLEPPLPWLWSCHHCHARYPLGTTRRCLHDGHYFCGGTTSSALTGKTIKRHRACGSEFDYLGWEDVYLQRKSLGGGTIGDRLKQRRGCEKSCEYPSACHHRRSQFAVKNSSIFGIEDSSPFLESSFFETSPSPSAPEAAETDIPSTLLVPKSTGLMIKDAITTAKCNTGAGNLSSRFERDITKSTLRPSRSAPPCPLSSSPPTHFAAAEPVGARASAKELGLTIASLDLSLSLPSFFSPDSSSSSVSSSSSSSSSSESTSSFSEEASSATRSSIDEDDEAEAEAEAEAAFNLFTKNIITTPPAIHRPLLLRNKINPNTTIIKIPHIVNLNLNLDGNDSPPDIDMTDYIPESPTSPTSPGYYAPPFITVTTTATSNIAAATPKIILTPKSPTSTTNPLWRHHRHRSSGSGSGSRDMPLSPLSPLSPWKKGAGLEEGREEQGHGDGDAVFGGQMEMEL